MKRLEQLYTEMKSEIPFVVNEELKPYILELAQIYAREVAKASLERAKKELVKSCKDVLPTTYRTGIWDGKNSDVVIAISKSGKYHVAFFNDGFMDGEKFECWYDENEYLIEEEITHWMELDYFKESITNESNITLL
ncbi:DUF551 domain-containing protein [Elizabethkingia anophelis]|uniref:DUF551 domain-containing protein n=1 Tax=Elizabethkingia anophelis TaxID=1117645 RepID=UPI00162978EA|nr:DUF551 domain-containing protein [Elizabethkingia anophelis]MCT4321834.1 hypothetical protein [Elizabethkingia anophelis]